MGMMNNPLEVLWIGFRTLQTLQEGCLGQKGVSLAHCSSFEEGRDTLAETPFDIVVLSLSARGAGLEAQVREIRELASESFLAVVVCNGSETELASRAGADDVMSLDDEGDLVCAPVLRWVEMRRKGLASLIDLRAASRKRSALAKERDRLKAEVAALSRQLVHDPASGVLSRTAFVLQLELATKLLGPSGAELHLIVFELAPFPEDWGDFVVGGFMNQIGQKLTEVAGKSAIVGRVAPSRFAVFVSGVSASDADWITAVGRDRLGEIEVPGRGPLEVAAAGGCLRTAEVTQPARRLLDHIEEELTRASYPTRVRRAARAAF